MAKRKPTKPIDFTYRYCPGSAPPFYRPEEDPSHAVDGVPEWLCVARKLVEGNLVAVRYLIECRNALKGEPPRFGSQIIELSDADVLLDPLDDNGFPLQLPMALVLGCVDARAPAEILFGMEFVNDVFNVRLAGNVVAEEGVGSVEYALRHLVTDEHHGHAPKFDAKRSKRLRIIVALGHEGCGAIAEAVRAYQLSPGGDKAVATGPVAALLGHLFFPSLILAAEAFDRNFGSDASRKPEHFGKLCRLTTYLNAAWGAHSLQELVRNVGGAIAEKVGVVYGVFDPRDMHVRAVPVTEGRREFNATSFGTAPDSLEELRTFAGLLARSMKDPGDSETAEKLFAYRVISAHVDE